MRQRAPLPWSDVARGHWAYAVLDRVANRELAPACVVYIPESDPPRNDRLPRILTRYEFAVAADRCLLAATDRRVHPTAALVADLTRLTDEFHAELNEIGLSRYQVRRRLDALRARLSHNEP